MKTKVSQELIDRLATETEGAYSFDRYANWKAVCAMLLRRGLTYNQAYSVLLSKWTRWAADASTNKYGRNTSADVARFLDKIDNPKPEIENLTIMTTGQPT